MIDCLVIWPLLACRCGGQHLCSAQPPQRKKDKHRYQYGNYSCYYGYHGFYGDEWEGRVGAEEDPRLRLLDANWFRDKKVLDIGCGTGHMTLAIARKYDPTHILGVELDEQLVNAARQNIRHFLSHDLVVKERSSKMGAKGRNEEKVEKLKEELDCEEVLQEVQQTLLSLPLSFRVSRGPLCAPSLLLPLSLSSSSFPNNITFIQVSSVLSCQHCDVINQLTSWLWFFPQGNYVTTQEDWPGRGQYDVILCLGVTKWVQLQSGDMGVVRLFRRAYQSLLPGGIFILEPQPWRRYSHSKRASVCTVTEGAFRLPRKSEFKARNGNTWLTTFH